MVKFSPTLEREADAKGAIAQLARGARGTGLVTAVGLGLAFALTIVLARVLGPTDYGALAYTLAWAEVLGMLAPLGFDKLIIREIAILREQSAWALLRGILGQTLRFTCIGIALAVLTAVSFGWLMRRQLDEAMFPVFWWAGPIIAARAMLHVAHGKLLGLSRPVAGMMATSVSYPAIFFALIAACMAVAPQRMSPTFAAGSAFAALVIAWMVAEFQTRARLDGVVRASPHTARTREWLRAALPMMFLIALALVNLKADLMMLGAMRGAAEAGIYAVAAQLAFLVRLGIVAVQPALAPLAAKADNLADAPSLQRVARAATRLAMVPATACAAALIAGGPWILPLFSAEYVAGYTPMVILAAALLAVTTLGPMETVLLMRGRQRLAASVAAIACVANIVLNTILIPRWGMTGAAAATAISTVIWAGTMAIATRRTLKLRMSLLARGDA